MWVVAALFAVILLAVPADRKVSADLPELSITIEVDEDSINYETAEATVTVSGVETLPEDQRNTWTVTIRTEVKGDSSTRLTKSGFSFGNPDANGVYSADVHLAKYDGEPESDHSNLTHGLKQGELQVVKAIVSYYKPEHREETAQAEFTTKGTDGCVKHENEESVSWNSSILNSESSYSETTLGFILGVKKTYAPVNSGRCIHYRYRKVARDEITEPVAVFVVNNPGNTKRQVVVKLTGLEPSTTYQFESAADERMQNTGIPYTIRTEGALPNVDTVAVRKSSITQTSAVADVTVANPNSDDLTVHLRYYKTADKDANPRTETTDSKPTVEGPLEFNLGSLAASTSYMVDASTLVDYHPSYTKTDTFPTLPNSPSLDSVEIGDGQLKVSWTKPDGGEAIDEYIVQWKSGSQTFQDATDDVTEDREASVAHVSGTTAYQTTITGLENGTQHTVQVIAKNESGQATSNTVTKKPASLPSAPKSLSVTPGNKQLTLSWQEPDELGGGITGYEVQSKKADDSTAVWATSSATVASETDAQSNVTTYSTTITGLDYSTKYDVRVRAKNSITKTNEEDYVWAKSTGTTIPDVPTGLKSESGNQQLTLSWKEPADLGTVAISDYVVQYRKTSETSWSTSGAANQESTDSETSVTTYSNIITGLDHSTDYDLRVRAENGVTLQNDDGYNWAIGDGQTIPDSPGNFEVVPGDEQLTLTWEAPADSGSLSIDGYVVQYKKTADASWSSLSTLGASTLRTIIGSLENDVAYSVRVRAVNTATLDDDEGYNWATEPGTPVPSPSIETVTVDANSVTQTGATVTITLDRTNGVTQKAHVQYQTVPNGGWSTPPKPGDIDAISGDIVLDSLKGNTEYEVQAWLETDVSTKVKSEPFTTKPVPPGVPTNSTFTAGDTIIELSWDPPSDDGGSTIDHYVIQWDELVGLNWDSPLGDVTTTDEEYDITGLTNGTRYAIRLRADNLAPLPTGKDYNWVFSNDTPSRKPDAPVIQSVTEADTKLTVTWNKPYNGGTGITKYLLRWKDSAVTGWASPLGTRTVDKDVLTTEIGSLTNGTTYAIQVRAKNENGDGPWSVEDTGTPRPDPSVDRIDVPDGAVTQTEAVATVYIADPTGESKTVYLQYGINTSPISWVPVPSQVTGTASVTFPTLTPLKSDTEYRVEASFDGTFNSGVEFKTFTTKRPTVSDVQVADSTVAQTSGRATVTILHPNGKPQTVYLRYRPITQNDWSTTASDAGEDTDTSSITTDAEIDIAGLKSDTDYEVEVSLESDYSQSDTVIFTTDPPTLTDINISEEMQESAKATVDIDEPHGRSLPVFVRYRKVTDPVNTDWKRRDTSSTMDLAVSTLTELTSGTKYEAQASLDDTFPDKEGITVTSDEFTTKDPSLSGLSWEAELTGATITVDIQAPNDQALTISYRYRPTSQADWSTTASDAGSDSTTGAADSEVATISLTDLSTSTKYEVQVSLSSDLVNPTLPVLDTTFTTLSPDTSIEKIEVSERTQNTAKVTVEVDKPDTNGNTVYLHFKKVDETAWSTPADTDDSDPDEVEFMLDELDAHSHYHVEVSLDSGFANSTTVPFWTLREPEIDSVNAVDTTKTSAKAVVDILYDDGTERTVHLRYIVKADSPDWDNDGTETSTTSDTATAEKLLEGLTAGTSYNLQASFDDSFPDEETEETEFTTKHLPSISQVIIDADTVTKESATAIVSIANPDGIKRIVYLQFRKKDATPEDEWSDPPLEEDEGTDEGSASFGLEDLHSGTEYEVQVSFDSNFETGVEDTTFTTKYLPSVSGVRVDPSTITKTTATAEVSIANPDGTLQTVHLCYIVYSATADCASDGTKVTTTSDTEAATKGLEDLLAGTNYLLLASFDDTFPSGATEQTTFPTDPEPSADSVSVSKETKTTATATVVIADPDGSEQAVHLQYRRESAAPTDAWETEEPETSTSASATFNLDDLTEGTTYDVEAWLARDTSHKVTTTFTTDAETTQAPPLNTTPPANINPPQQRTPTPSVSDVTFANITQTAADATVSLRNAGTGQKTVRLRYREDGTTRWTSAPAKKTNGASTTISLTGLTAGTTYEVQAWLTTNSPPSGTQIYEFTTLDEVVPEPSIADLECENIGQTFATAIVKIANAGTDMKEIYLKHSVDGVDSWTTLPSPSVTYTDSTSISLTGLQVGTTYELAVALTNDFNGMLTCSFTTLASDPSVSGIGISDITNTSAMATVNIASPGTAQKSVHLRYREFGEAGWGTAQTKSTTGASAQFSLTSLSPRTTYEVQASLASDFSASRSVMFTTSTPDPSVSGINMGNITDTSASATVGIAHPGTAQKTVHLRYRVFGKSEWSTAQTETTSGSSAQFDLTGLEPRTKYEVEASLSSDFTGSKTATFTTLVPDPSVSSVSIGNITQTSAVATTSIADAGEAQKTVHLRHRVEGTEEWSDPALTATTYGASVTIDIAGLTPDTSYEVQASLDDSFAAYTSVSFSTLRYPSLSDIDVTGITKTTATAEIDIADPDGTTQTVHLRYRTATPQGAWSGTQTTTSASADASIGLTGLTTDTEYEVEASLTSDFTDSVSDTFTTLPPDPVVSGVSVSGITQTTATANIDIANSDGSSQTVNLRYRTTTPRGDWSATLTTASSTDSASIDLAGLTPGTEYDVQASLDGTFLAARTKYDTFTTLRYPSIASLEAGNIGRNGATVSATIADSQGESQTVYVRHRQSRYIAWRTTQQTDSVDDVANLRLRGLSSGTEYIAEASLDSSFPDEETRSVAFTTKERKDDDDTVVVQEARSVNVPLPGFSPQMLRFVAIEGGDSPAPQTFSVWNRAQGTMDFILSNQQEWLSEQPTSGMSAGPADPVTITASVDSSELASGQYVDIISIDVSASGRSPDQVVVVLDVLPPDYVRQFVSRSEGGTVVLPDGTVKIVVQPLSPPKDVDIELMKLNLQAHGAPPGERERVVVAIESNTYEPGGDTPEDIAYLPYVTLWVMLPDGEEAACTESRVRMYSVQGDWSLVEHSCETDESGNVWVVADVERLGAFALVIDDSPVTPTPTPAAAAIATPTGSVIGSASSATVRTSLPAMPPTPVPTAVPTAVPAPVAQAAAALEPATTPTPTATAIPQTVDSTEPVLQASADPDGSGGMSGVILAAIGLPMLLGAMLLGYLIYREKRRRNGNHI